MPDRQHLSYHGDLHEPTRVWGVVYYLLPRELLPRINIHSGPGQRQELLYWIESVVVRLRRHPVLFNFLVAQRALIPTSLLGDLLAGITCNLAAFAHLLAGADCKRLNLLTGAFHQSLVGILNYCHARCGHSFWLLLVGHVVTKHLSFLLLHDCYQR